MGQDLYHDPLPTADTFKAARQKVLNAIAADELDEANAVATAGKLGKMVGAYYKGLIDTGAEQTMAELLAERYHDFLLEQVALSAAGIRAVKNG